VAVEDGNPGSIVRIKLESGKLVQAQVVDANSVKITH